MLPFVQAVIRPSVGVVVANDVVFVEAGAGLHLDHIERRRPWIGTVAKHVAFTGGGTRHGTEATGLGLAICKGLVEVHGGRVRAGSAGLGHGARFTFTLPVAASDLPVMFISAYGRDETIVRAFEAGVADYIVKPFSSIELVARVGAVLSARAGAGPFVLGVLAIYYERAG